MEFANVHAELFQVLPPSTDYLLLLTNAMLSLAVGFGGVYLGYRLSQRQRYKELEVARLASLQSGCLYFHSLCATQLNNISNFLVPICKISEHLRLKRQMHFFSTVKVVDVNNDRFCDVLCILPNLSVSVSRVLSSLEAMNGMLDFTKDNMIRDAYDSNNAFPLVGKQIWEALDISILCYEKLDRLLTIIMHEYRNAEYEFFCAFKMKHAFNNKLLIEKKNENTVLLNEARRVKDSLKIALFYFYITSSFKGVRWNRINEVSCVKKRR